MDTMKFWDKQARRKFAFPGAKKKIIDNIWKRQAIVKRLLAYDLYNKSILEIGVGPGTTFAAIKLILLNRFDYIGTDVSKEYTNFVKEKFKMRVVQTDITNLPGSSQSYDYVVALDVLAHVDPKYRLIGFTEIKRVLKNKGHVILNITKTKPDPSAFDWGFSSEDLETLMSVCDLTIERLEPYEIEIPGIGEAGYTKIGHKKIKHYEFFIGRKKF